MTENRAPDESPDGPQGDAADLTPPPAPIRRRRPTPRFVRVALLFESGLGGLALALAWLAGFSWTALGITPAAPPLSYAAAALAGLLDAIPMLTAMVLLDRRPPSVLRAFRDQIAREIVPLFQRLRFDQLLLISLAAGIGEELLFRGLLQQGLISLLGGGPAATLAGLVVASLLFGACHFLNATYAILAALVGFYLGLLLVSTGHLLAPVLTHAAYDLGALVYLTRSHGEAS